MVGKFKDQVFLENIPEAKAKKEEAKKKPRKPNSFWGATATKQFRPRGQSTLNPFLLALYSS